jgi:hypothetical protein
MLPLWPLLTSKALISPASPEVLCGRDVLTAQNFQYPVNKAMSDTYVSDFGGTDVCLVVP